MHKSLILRATHACAKNRDSLCKSHAINPSPVDVLLQVRSARLSFVKHTKVERTRLQSVILPMNLKLIVPFPLVDLEKPQTATDLSALSQPSPHHTTRLSSGGLDLRSGALGALLANDALSLAL